MCRPRRAACAQGRTLRWWHPEQSLHLAGLTWGQDATLSPVPVALLLGALAAMAFVGWERRQDRLRRAALLDVSLFALPTFAWGNVPAMLVAVG